MICRRCLSRMTRLRETSTPARRWLSNTPTAAAEETISVKAIEQAKPKASTPSTASQPFTVPAAMSPSSRGSPPSKKKASDAPLVVSSCPAGTPLKGLNFLKGKSDPLAMEDHEYPDWLWTILDPKKKAGDEAVNADIYSKSKSKRQKAKKALKGAGTGGPDVFDKVPIYEQTVDLPIDDPIEAARARDELTKAMRVKRRADIKEANFLRTMR